MKFSTSALALGAASTAFAVQDQKVLNKPGSSFFDNISGSGFNFDLHFDSWVKEFKDTWGDISSEAKATWQEIAMVAPEAMEAFKRTLEPTKPRKVTRKPDSHWDHIVKGADLEALTVTDSNGQSRRKIGGKLEQYDLRARNVDPKKLGVDDVKQYAGYLDDNEEDKHLFYWFFESRNDPKNDPVVLWLNGGPGCSSMMGLFMELGPATIDEKGEVVRNPHAWNNNASVIFIDQPVGVGYSYGSSTVDTTVAASKDIYALLSLFFHQFPEYAHQDFHIAGESYGGHYVPVFSSEILSHEDRNINLKSILVGNGLTDEHTQYAHYRPMACGEGGYPAVLDEQACQSMDNALPRCQSLIESCYESESAWSCVPAAIYCNSQFIMPYQRTGLNPYDIRMKCENEESLCYNSMGYIVEWLNRADVQETLGVEVEEFKSCNYDINLKFMFRGDWMKPIHRYIPKVLEQIPVLIYAGDADFICNWLGNRAWVEKLEWHGRERYADAKRKGLFLGGSKGKDNKEYGNVKTAHNLTFIQIYEAGHMTPYDQPAASSDFLNRWIRGEWVA